MFGQRVKEILTLFRVSAAEFARVAECDPSYISRMASGARVPRKNGAGARRLVDALFTYADDHGLVPLLCKTVSCSSSLSTEEIKVRTATWLYEGEAEAASMTEQKKQVPHRAFGEKLDAVMELADLSNVRLGKRINLDASYISRFRNGLRSPRANPATTDALCAALLDQVAKQNRLRQFSALTRIPAEDLEDEEEALFRFRAWLFGTDEGDDAAPLAEKLLENIDAFSLKTPPVPPVLRQSENDDARTVYFGTDGLQRAVLRFLTAVAQKGNGEMYLYSDQNTDWMSDPPFRAAWAAGMLHCVNRGTQIRIIHNIDRNPDEMIDAITNWLPLYMTGAIESYYCKKQRNPRFSNTLFLCPGVACICGGNPAGTEKESGVYRYDVSSDLLAAHHAAFDRLTAESKPLVRTFRGVNTDLSSFAKEGGVTVLGTTLSAVTLPEATLQALLIRSGLPEDAQRKQRAGWEGRKKAFLKDLNAGFVHECVPMATDEALHSGAVPVDLPDLKLTYTPQEYAEHVNQILRFSEEFPGYRFFPLPDAAFANTKILISDAAVAVIRLKEPHITFMISHPAMYRAFSDYAQRIKNQFRQDRISLRRNLLRYL